VKLWDVATGQELRTLKTRRVSSLAFSPDGRQLLSVADDGSVQSWDARSWTAERAVEREALVLVEFLFGKLLTRERVFEDLRANKTISQLVRQKALSLADDYWKGVVRQHALRLVDSLFAKLMPKQKVLENIRKNDTLNDAVRQDALVLTEGWREDAGAFYRASWEVVRRPGAESSAYRIALARAQHACVLQPDNGSYVLALAVAHYRVGQYPQALETLSRSNHFQLTGVLHEHPTGVAFLAMTVYQIGLKKEAQQVLVILRKTLEKPEWTGVAQEQAFLREAEALIQGARESLKK
jgi:hypothetical protein